MLIRLGKLRYAWVTAAPGLFMMPICIRAGYLNITKNFLPHKLYLLAGISVILMALMTIVITLAFRRWYALVRIGRTVADSWPSRPHCPLLQLSRVKVFPADADNNNGPAI